MNENQNEYNNEHWGLHAVIFKKPYDLEKAKEEVKHFIKNGKKQFYRETTNSYRFRNIPKTKFIKKSFRTKKLGNNISIILGELLPEHLHLEGAGLFDLFKKPARHALAFFKNPVQKVKEVLAPRVGYNNTTTKNLNSFGNLPVKSLMIARTPILKILDKTVNLITLGKWNKLKNEYGFDKMYHLALIANVGNKNLVIEKNEVINVNTNYKMTSKTETLDVPLNGKTFTINEMLNKTRERLGEKMFYSYDAFNNNCQVFIKECLTSENLYNEPEKNFLFQDLTELQKKVPTASKKIMNATTHLGAVVNKLTGQGENKEEPIKLLLKKNHKLILTANNYNELKELVKQNVKPPTKNTPVIIKCGDEVYDAHLTPKLRIVKKKVKEESETESETEINNKKGSGKKGRGKKMSLEDEFLMDEKDHNKKLINLENSKPNDELIRHTLKGLKSITASSMKHIKKLTKMLNSESESESESESVCECRL